ncbi:MAG: type I restriction endonuclease subunit S [Bacteroidetes bacterium RIFOXYA12_FULL_35_11]|nr:MAG: type I restriction endonuclease subunit S [Bacteroidetes bacterium GWF2_35_48]OFY77885.1 MAG: type I restriction endonuclease subunit S [Bacteroidetes bacterium RIFOXYA12_FULL_35_11]OFY96031.1 MAG: type I restriction endonuclease subunit S [Bacteroidetes bacterium RIFOXYC12_FULL_35_7]HBX50358.1 type I restriction endonuclease subunit S [Bacteroidales bacterium]
MSEWKKYKLDELGSILNNKRIPLNSRERAERKGKYPYYGASGIVDYIDDFIFEGEHVLISEDGENLRSRQTPIAFKANGKFWVNNHAHIFKGKEDWINDYIVYYLKHRLKPCNFIADTLVSIKVVNLQHGTKT